MSGDPSASLARTPLGGVQAMAEISLACGETPPSLIMINQPVAFHLTRPATLARTPIRPHTTFVDLVYVRAPSDRRLVTRLEELISRSLIVAYRGGEVTLPVSGIMIVVDILCLRVSS